MGDDAANTLAAALFEGGTVDFAVRDLQTAPALPPAGVFDRQKGRETVDTPRDGTKADRHVGRALIAREGALSFPVDVAVTLDDDSVIRRSLDGRARWQWIDVDGKSPLRAVEVDPEKKILLDDNLSNNSKRKRPGTSARIFERAQYFVGLVLSVLGP
jgi:hypothetical protein